MLPANISNNLHLDSSSRRRRSSRRERTSVRSLVASAVTTPNSGSASNVAPSSKDLPQSSDKRRSTRLPKKNRSRDSDTSNVTTGDNPSSEKRTSKTFPASPGRRRRQRSAQHTSNLAKSLSGISDEGDLPQQQHQSKERRSFREQQRQRQPHTHTNPQTQTLIRKQSPASHRQRRRSSVHNLATSATTVSAMAHQQPSSVSEHQRSSVPNLTTMFRQMIVPVSTTATTGNATTSRRGSSERNSRTTRVQLEKHQTTDKAASRRGSSERNSRTTRVQLEKHQSMDKAASRQGSSDRNLRTTRVQLENYQYKGKAASKSEHDGSIYHHHHKRRRSDSDVNDMVLMPTLNLDGPSTRRKATRDRRVSLGGDYRKSRSDILNHDDKQKGFKSNSKESCGIETPTLVKKLRQRLSTTVAGENNNSKHSRRLSLNLGDNKSPLESGRPSLKGYQQHSSFASSAPDVTKSLSRSNSSPSRMNERLQQKSLSTPKSTTTNPSNSKRSSRSSLTSMLSARWKQTTRSRSGSRSRRSELVQQLSKRDSLRVRDGAMINQSSKALVQAPSASDQMEGAMQSRKASSLTTTTDQLHHDMKILLNAALSSNDTEESKPLDLLSSKSKPKQCAKDPDSSVEVEFSTKEDSRPQASPQPDQPDIFKLAATRELPSWPSPFGDTLVISSPKSEKGATYKDSNALTARKVAEILASSNSSLASDLVELQLDANMALHRELHAAETAGSQRRDSPKRVSSQKRDKFSRESKSKASGRDNDKLLKKSRSTSQRQSSSRKHRRNGSRDRKLKDKSSSARLSHSSPHLRSTERKAVSHHPRRTVSLEPKLKSSRRRSMSETRTRNDSKNQKNALQKSQKRGPPLTWKNMSKLGSSSRVLRDSSRHKSRSSLDTSKGRKSLSQDSLADSNNAIRNDSPRPSSSKPHRRLSTKIDSTVFSILNTSKRHGILETAAKYTLSRCNDEETHISERSLTVADIALMGDASCGSLDKCRHEKARDLQSGQMQKQTGLGSSSTVGKTRQCSLGKSRINRSKHLSVESFADSSLHDLSDPGLQSLQPPADKSKQESSQACPAIGHGAPSASPRSRAKRKMKPKSRKKLKKQGVVADNGEVTSRRDDIVQSQNQGVASGKKKQERDAKITIDSSCDSTSNDKVANVPRQEPSLESMNHEGFEAIRKQHLGGGAQQSTSNGESHESEDIPLGECSASHEFQDRLSQMPSQGSSAKQGEVGTVEEYENSDSDEASLRLPWSDNELASLEAIANDDSKHSANYNEVNVPVEKDNFFLLSPGAADVFHDSPETSPLSASLPHIFGPGKSDSIVERLGSSMPELGSGGWKKEEEALKRTSATSDQGIFQDDDSDGSNPSQAFRALDRTGDDHHVDVMSQVAHQVKNSQSPVALASSSSPTMEAWAQIKSSSIVAVASSRLRARMDANCRNKTSEDSKKSKIDRGPRKPQRRGISFDDGKTDATNTNDEQGQMCDLTIKTSVPTPADNQVVPQATDNENNATITPVDFRHMEFRRTGDRGWVLTNPRPLMDRATSLVDVEASPQAAIMHASSAGVVDQPRETNFAFVEPTFRRSVSTGDIDLHNRTVIGVERWKSNLGDKEDAPPSFVRQRHQLVNDDNDDKEPLFSLETKETLRFMSASERTGRRSSLGRTYLPAQLQSDSGKHARYEKVVQKLSASVKRNSNSGNAFVAETGMPGVFEMISELERDLAKFEKQVVLLREQKEQNVAKRSRSDVDGKNAKESDTISKSS